MVCPLGILLSNAEWSRRRDCNIVFWDFGLRNSRPHQVRQPRQLYRGSVRRPAAVVPGPCPRDSALAPLRRRDRGNPSLVGNDAGDGPSGKGSGHISRLVLFGRMKPGLTERRFFLGHPQNGLAADGKSAVFLFRLSPRQPSRLSRPVRHTMSDNATITHWNVSMTAWNKVRY